MNGNRPSFEVAPSILAADFSRLGEQVASVAAAGVKMVHVDVMDGHFVPNISIGVPVVQSLRRATDLYLDCHLMIDDPDRYAEAFASAGAQCVSIHQEATRHLHRSLALIRELGVDAGVVINPATPVETLLEVLDMVQLVLVMSVNPGFGGQTFLPSSLKKVARLADLRFERGLDFRIEVDGGVGPDNAAALVDAGCDILVAGSSVFRHDDPADGVRALQAAVEQGMLQRA